MSAENSAVRAMRRASDALLARDIKGYADELAEEFVYEDRRSGLKSTHGKREELENFRAMDDFGLERYDLEVLETQGDDTALYRLTWHISGFEVVVLLVGRANAEGKGVVAIMFDEDDLEAARAELEVQSGAR